MPAVKGKKLGVRAKTWKKGKRGAAKPTSATRTSKGKTRGPAARKAAPAKKSKKSVKAAVKRAPKKPVKPVKPVAKATKPAPTLPKAKGKAEVIELRKKPVAKPAGPRPRRSRTRVISDEGPLAAWIPQSPEARPRSSSFIPAPPRAEGPSNVAAPPASADREVRADDLLSHPIRTFPVRVDIEQSGGKTLIALYPEELTIKPGDGIEWDFRYLGSADVIVEEVIIEFDKPAPFGKPIFRSKKPGSALPHRQLSGATTNSTTGKRIQYTIRCMNLFKTEVAKVRPYLNIQ